jgi:hypothetical protein
MTLVCLKLSLESLLANLAPPLIRAAKSDN